MQDAVVSKALLLCKSVSRGMRGRAVSMLASATKSFCYIELSSQVIRGRQERYLWQASTKSF